MLTVMLVRASAATSMPSTTSRFEAAAWYWHFVDVVWLLLFILVYWLYEPAARPRRRQPRASHEGRLRDPAQP